MLCFNCDISVCYVNVFIVMTQHMYSISYFMNKNESNLMFHKYNRYIFNYSFIIQYITIAMKWTCRCVEIMRSFCLKDKFLNQKNSSKHHELNKVLLYWIYILCRIINPFSLPPPPPLSLSVYFFLCIHLHSTTLVQLQYVFLFMVTNHAF